MELLTVNIVMLMRWYVDMVMVIWQFVDFVICTCGDGEGNAVIWLR